MSNVYEILPNLYPMHNFKWRYLVVFFLLLSAELVIAIYHFNPFFRGFLGDTLVILLLYSLLKIFIRNKVLKTAIAVLAFAFFVEFLQYLKFSEILHIHSKILLTVVGSVFDVWDLIAYFIGFLAILLIENFIDVKHK